VCCGRVLARTRSIPRDAKTIDRSGSELDASCSRYPAISLQSAEVAAPKNDSKSVAYEFRTKSAKSGALETNGPRERISGHRRGVAVRRFSREARGYWAFAHARKPAENVLCGRAGGGRGPANKLSLRSRACCCEAKGKLPGRLARRRPGLKPRLARARTHKSGSSTPPLMSAPLRKRPNCRNAAQRREGPRADVGLGFARLCYSIH
jgi:hypothetical protein